MTGRGGDQMWPPAVRAKVADPSLCTIAHRSDRKKRPEFPQMGFNHAWIYQKTLSDLAGQQGIERRSLYHTSTHNLLRQLKLLRINTNQIKLKTGISKLIIFEQILLCPRNPSSSRYAIFHIIGHSEYTLNV